MRGDQGFDDFYRSAYRRIVGEVFLLAGDLHDAEDIAQEAFTRAAARWERVRALDHPAAWVRRVAFNLATDATRRARRRVVAFTRLGVPPSVPPLTAEEVALTVALRALPLRYREVIVLHHLVDLPVEEIAARLAIPSGTVKTRLARGRAKLAERLGPPAADSPAVESAAGDSPSVETRSAR